MNQTQIQAVEEFAFSRRCSHRFRGKIPGVKTHRVFYLLPTFIRDGFKSQAHADLLRHWGPNLCRHYVMYGPPHLRMRAEQALLLLP